MKRLSAGFAAAMILTAGVARAQGTADAAAASATASKKTPASAMAPMAPTTAMAATSATTAAPATAANGDKMKAMADNAKSDFLMLYDMDAKKIHDLANAIPEEKYGWKPVAGVRTVGEVVNHISGATYFFAHAMGVAMPADAPKDSEKGPEATSKKDVIAALDKAIAFGRANVVAAGPAELEAKHDFFGNQMSGRALFMASYGHMSEHLGQLIAYARSAGVTPPWSK
ncbi:MAG: DinB family protein [Thermoanaerobaculia bacterium]